MTSPLEVAIKALEEMGAELAKQDNACTSHPIFVVQQRHRIYGLDTDYAQGDDDIVWINSDYEATGEERAALEAKYQEDATEPDGWHRTGFIDEWRFVQPFFTRAAAERYIEKNRHRLKDPRVFVDSAYRNDEWQAIRALLTTIRAAAAPGEAPRRLSCAGCGALYDATPTTSTRPGTEPAR